jgi:small conductance mechanosensitive channel
MAVKLLGIALQAGNKVDTTLTNYIKSIAGVVLTIGLVLAVMLWLRRSGVEGMDPVVAE